MINLCHLCLISFLEYLNPVFFLFIVWFCPCVQVVLFMFCCLYSFFEFVFNKLTAVFRPCSSYSLLQPSVTGLGWGFGSQCVSGCPHKDRCVCVCSKYNYFKYLCLTVEVFFGLRDKLSCCELQHMPIIMSRVDPSHKHTRHALSERTHSSVQLHNASFCILLLILHITWM